MTTTARGGDAGAVASWRLWVVPLAAGIFAGAAAFEVLPFAVRRIGLAAAAWGLGGLLVFVAIHKGLDALGHHGAAGASTLGMWLHALLEGGVPGAASGGRPAPGVQASLR